MGMEIVMLAFMLVCIVILIMVVFMTKSNKQNGNMKEMLLESEKRQQEALFETQQKLQEAIVQFQTTMTNSVKQDLAHLNETTTQHLYTIQKGVNENLSVGYDKTSKVFSQVLERMGKLDESQNSLKELSMSITHLQSILTDKKTRGIFGEIELYSLLETAMGTDEKPVC